MLTDLQTLCMISVTARNLGDTREKETGVQSPGDVVCVSIFKTLPIQERLTLNSNECDVGFRPSPPPTPHTDSVSVQTHVIL